MIGPQRRQIKAFHSGRSTPCLLYLDPDETGGALIPVSYEVSAGAVSTTSGVEWVEPPEVHNMSFATPPAPPGPYNQADYATTVLDPAGFDQDPDSRLTYMTAPPAVPLPAPSYPAARPAPTPGTGVLGDFPLVPVLLIVAIALLLVLIAIMLFRH